MTEKMNYRIWVGHYDQKHDIMNDEQCVTMNNATFKEVWERCEILFSCGFDIVCERSHDCISWEHAFCF